MSSIVIERPSNKALSLIDHHPSMFMQFRSEDPTIVAVQHKLKQVGISGSPSLKTRRHGVFKFVDSGSTEPCLGSAMQIG